MLTLAFFAFLRRLWNRLRSEPVPVPVRVRNNPWEPPRQ